MMQEQEHAKIRRALQAKYAEISRSAIGKFTYLTGYEGVQALQYDTSGLSRLSNEHLKSFCGVGNPFLAGPIDKGESLLDVGCGSGIDLVVASHYVGDAGRICGIDITSEMLSAATRNLQAAGMNDFELKEGSAESIPYEDSTFDIVISNGVLNLSTRKELAFSEILRVLVPDGRLQFPDIVLEDESVKDTSFTLESWLD